MVRFQISQVRLHSGETVEIRLLPDGRSVCPVCGLMAGGEPAYSYGECGQAREPAREVQGEARAEPQFGRASFDICPDCHTQYGESDSAPDFPGHTQAEVWEVLRIRWLDLIHWSQGMLDRLQRNLDIDVEALKRRAKKD